MSKLTGKVAVVTGASKGIGAAIAKSLTVEGASVVVNYASSKAGADTVVAAITAAGGKAVAVPGDVSKATEAQGVIEAAIKNYGRLDILVNNSGVSARAARVRSWPFQSAWRDRRVCPPGRDSAISPRVCFRS
jgi:3-oxoacyl-[acyl-carrier protein] reductase